MKYRNYSYLVELAEILDKIMSIRHLDSIFILSTQYVGLRIEMLYPKAGWDLNLG